MLTAGSALLAESNNFREVLELRPCGAVPSLVEIRISSWWRDAKQPETPQVRFQTFITPETLYGLKDALEAVLARLASPNEMAEG
jgi:hypothetical protein